MYYCPECGNPLVFVTHYNRWFCQHCEKYPSLVHYDSILQNYNPNKNARLSFISFVGIILGFVIFFSFLFGLISAHHGLAETFERDNVEYDEFDSYYGGYDHYYEEDRDIDGSLLEFSRGLFLIFFAIILVFCIIGMLDFTVRNRSWWLKMNITTDSKRYWHLETARMKKLTVKMFYGIYALIVMMGFIQIIIGLQFLYKVDNLLIIVAVIDVFIGTLLIFLSLKFFFIDSDVLALEVYPVLEHTNKKVEKKPTPTPVASES